MNRLRTTWLPLYDLQVMVDDTNRAVWSTAHGEYINSQNWLDRGERVAIWSAASAARGGSILDIGVGAGRSCGLLGLLSENYTAVDYVDEMVAAARAEFPELDIRWGDARSLDFADGPFGLVFFGNTGLDSMTHQDRQLALQEMYRILAPGGTLIYSTLNRHGPFFKAGPGPIPAVPEGRITPYRLARFVLRSASRPTEHVRAFRNVRRNNALFEDHGSWAVDTMPTHEWALVVHYVTGAYARDEANSLGLQDVRLLDRDGVEIAEGSQGQHTPWMYVVARKPVASEA